VRNRREFLRDSSAAGAGLVIAMSLPSCASRKGVQGSSDFVPNAWLRITPENRIIFILDRVEMGQGVMTSHAALIAEELGLEPSDLEIQFAVADRKYDNPALGFQLTGGSTSTRGSWEPLREAGAIARGALTAAAAEIWGVSPNEVTLGRGEFSHRDTGRKLTFGQCANQAADHLGDADLKPPEQWKVIGRGLPRLDSAPKSTGRARFGIDVRVPGMLTAVVIRGPVIRAEPKKIDSAEAEKMEGVSKIVVIPGGVGVLADSYWHARAAAEKVIVEWEKVELSTESIRAMFRAAAEKEGKVATKEGWFDKAFAAAEKRVRAIYEFPYLAHATMEPQNATAHVKSDRCDIWAPTQSPGSARLLVAKLLDFDLEQVNVETTYLGGGFGRRIGVDYVLEAVHLSKAAGAPVQVIWSREDDLRHDIYRPGSFHVAQAGLLGGRISGWSHKIASPSLYARIGSEFVWNMAPSWISGVGRALGDMAGGLFEGTMADPSSIEGAAELPYAIDDVRVEWVFVDPGVPIGFWRSVGHSFNAFVVETMMDELATLADADPFEFRRGLLQKKSPRNLAVLELAAVKAGWSSPLPEGRFRGIAQHASFGSFVAQVAEVSVVEGEIRVHRVVAAIDCGRTVNPEIVRAQIESAIVFGLTAALKNEIHFEEGSAVEGNFDSYPMLRMNEMPDVEVHIVESDASPSGVGEPGVPPIAPAVANAVFRATGKRLRKLPLRLA
jgi:isoquinoline 1-oxidoreductase subunit beta